MDDGNNQVKREDGGEEEETVGKKLGRRDGWRRRPRARARRGLAIKGHFPWARMPGDTVAWGGSIQVPRQRSLILRRAVLTVEYDQIYSRCSDLGGEGFSF
jgi:hypothetical protein